MTDNQNTRATPAAPQVDAGELREKVERRVREMLQDLIMIGNRYSDTTLRVATDWLMQEYRLADKAILPMEGRREVTEECAKAIADAIPLPGNERQLRGTYAQGMFEAMQIIRSLLPESPDLATRAATLESELERVREEMVARAEAAARGLV